MRALLALALGLTTLTAPVSAQDAATGFLLELNKISDTDNGACQVVFLGQNNFDTGLDEITLRLALIDDKGVFTNMLSLPFGKLAASKRRFAQYNLPTACSGISEIVVNDVAACKTAGSTQDSPICAAELSVSSRTSIGLGI